MNAATDYTVHMYDTVAYIEGSESAAIAFSPSPTASYGQATPAPIKKVVSHLDVAPWGEDNRFPQNIVHQMDWYGVGKAGLDWKARALWGNGILPVEIIGYEDEGLAEKVKPLDRSKYKAVYDFIENPLFYRFYLELLQDWVWFVNCFPELIFDNFGQKITGLVHQESCDCLHMKMSIRGN